MSSVTELDVMRADEIELEAPEEFYPKSRADCDDLAQALVVGVVRLQMFCRSVGLKMSQPMSFHDRPFTRVYIIWGPAAASRVLAELARWHGKPKDYLPPGVTP